MRAATSAMCPIHCALALLNLNMGFTRDVHRRWKLYGAPAGETFGIQHVVELPPRRAVSFRPKLCSTAVSTPAQCSHRVSHMLQAARMHGGLVPTPHASGGAAYRASAGEWILGTPLQRGHQSHNAMLLGALCMHGCARRWRGKLQGRVGRVRTRAEKQGTALSMTALHQPLADEEEQEVIGAV